MSADSVARDPERIADAYRLKALAEISDADRELPGADAMPCSGDPLARVMLVKGEPGPAEISGGVALSGADGEAAVKALSALGFDPDSVFAVVSRPVEGGEPDARIRRLAMLVEAVDPSAVVGLDATAAADIAAALEIPEIAFGAASRTAGRTIVCVDGLEASLSDERRKRRVWHQLRALAPAEPVW